MRRRQRRLRTWWRHGHRRLHFRCSGQASSRSLGRREVTAPCGAPTLGLPVLAGASGEAVDASTLSFLTAEPLGDTRKEEEARKEAKEEAKRRKKQDAVDAATVEFRTLLLLPPEQARRTFTLLSRLLQGHGERGRRGEGGREGRAPPEAGG